MSRQPAFDKMSVQSLSGAGPRTVALLKKLEIFSVWDLLIHCPFRYEDRTRVTPISQLKINEVAVVEGSIQSVTKLGNRKFQLVCQVADDTGHITVRFFHFNAEQVARLQSTLKIRCFGEVREGHAGVKELIHPECQFLDAYVPLPKHFTPVYHTTKGVSQWMLRKLIQQALSLLEKAPLEQEDLPVNLREEFHLPALFLSLQGIHSPMAQTPLEFLDDQLQPLQRRLAFEELLAHQLGMHQLRQEMQHHQAPSLQNEGQLPRALIDKLSFKLTGAQQRVILEINEDLKQTRPMLRLVQGDVGSGKTIVAALTMLAAVESGYQAVIMAPTELLAEQHFQSFKSWLEPLGISVAWLSGAVHGSLRTKALHRIEKGEDSIIVGTHALFQEQVNFQRLGMLVVDEQHRFGVAQRLALLKKGEAQGYLPHQLIMTATPIPRTLAMVAYSDLDCSVIDETPPGRKPITTVVISNNRRQEVLERVRAHCEHRKQVYWVCTLIEESEVLACQAAEITAQNLQQALPHLKIALIHGRMKPDEKEREMQGFKQGEIDLLVATTVIEVGVDVPNASLMVIENSERLGLAQLHQLRGRVGRGQEQSYCVLLYQKPLSKVAKKRLEIMRSTQDGFEIAEHDLEIRGPGELLGVKQAGLMQLRVADPTSNPQLLIQVKQACEKVIKNHPEVSAPLFKRWFRKNEEFLKI